MHRHYHQQQQRHRSRFQPWRQPKYFFFLIIAIFLINFIAAIAVIHFSFFNVAVYGLDGPFSISSSTSTNASAGTIKSAVMPSTSNRFSTESRLWHRMLLALQEKKSENVEEAEKSDHDRIFLCGDIRKPRRPKKNITESFWRNSQETSLNELVPFGFFKSVRSYVEKERNKTSVSLRSSSLSSTTASSSYCIAPTSDPSCDSYQYTVIIYSSSTDTGADTTSADTTGTNSRKDEADSSKSLDYWRRMLLTSMKFLAYPSVERVNLVLRVRTDVDDDYFGFGFDENKADKNHTAPSDSIRKRREAKALSHLQKASRNNKYARRILEWDKKGICRVIITSSLWNALDRLDVPSESILWIDGDKSDHQIRKSNGDRQYRSNPMINGTMLKQRFRLWKQVPNNALVIPGNDEADHRIYASPSPQKKNKQQRNKHQKHATFSSSSSDCPLLLSPLPLLKLHGMMMHKNFLCYLNHPTIGSDLRNYTNSLFLKKKDENGNDKYAMVDDDHIEKSSTSDFSSLPFDVSIITIGMLLSHISDGYVMDNNDLGFKIRTKMDDNRVDLMEDLIDDHVLTRRESEKLMNHYMKQIISYFGYDAGMGMTRSIPKLSVSSKQPCISDRARRFLVYT